MSFFWISKCDFLLRTREKTVIESLGIAHFYIMTCNNNNIITSVRKKKELNRLCTFFHTSKKGIEYWFNRNLLQLKFLIV